MSVLVDVPAGETGIAPVDNLRSELAKIEMNVLTSYTLADAIREGASVTEKFDGGWIDDTRSCGNGAAWIAAKARGYIK